MVKISIITTAYNAEKYISETINSVLSQKGDFELEYILFDASSTDNTFLIMKEFQALVDNGFYKDQKITMKIFSEPDNGMYEGIAKGFKLATGDIVAYINADDFYMPNAFDCVCHIFDKYHHVNWLIGRINDYNERGHVIDSYLPVHYTKEFIKKGVYGRELIFIQQESCFWRKELLDDLDYATFSKFQYAGDYYLWYTFCDKHSLYSLDSNLSGFRFLPEQKSTNKTAYFEEYNKIVNYCKFTKKDLLKIQYARSLYKFSDNLKAEAGNAIRWNFQKSDWEIIEPSLDFKKIACSLSITNLKDIRKTTQGFKKFIFKLTIILITNLLL